MFLLVACAYAHSAAAEPTAASIKLPSGVTLHYVVQGAAGGEPIVLLHGIGDSWHSYELVLPHIPDRFRVYALSLRGHGWSDAPAAGYAQRDFAADVASFMAQLDLRNVTLAGHSLGSFVAQAVAAQDRGRISKLVLIGSGPGGIGAQEIRNELQVTFRAMRGTIDPGFARDFQMSVVHVPVPAAFMERMYDQILRAAPHMWSLAAEAMYSAETAEALPRIKPATLLVWGERDPLLGRADQDTLLARLPNARLIVFTGNGHTPHWEDPERFAKELTAFASANAGSR
jgi:pimeloyl-ACP methyl ester carboxylesterase